MTHHHQFERYAPREPAYDEMFAGSGPRSAYAHLVDTFGSMSERDLSARVEALQSSYLDQGVTFDIGGEERAFPLDIVPRVIEAETVDADRRRRPAAGAGAGGCSSPTSTAPGDVFRDGVIPRGVITTSTHFHREAFGYRAAQRRPRPRLRAST